MTGKANKKTIMGWNHCHPCSKSFGRFWFHSKEDFMQELAMEHPCPWCKEKSVIYHELDEDVMPKSQYAVDIYGVEASKPKPREPAKPIKTERISLYDKTNRYTEDALVLATQAEDVLDKVFLKWVAAGYSPREISHVIHGVVTDMELEEILGWANANREWRESIKQGLEEKSEREN